MTLAYSPSSFNVKEHTPKCNPPSLLGFDMLYSTAQKGLLFYQNFWFSMHDCDFSYLKKVLILDVFLNWELKFDRLYHLSIFLEK